MNKRPLFKNFRGKPIVNPSYIGYLCKYNIKVMKSKNRIVLLFYTERIYQEFMKRFEVMPSCICIIKKMAFNELFVHLHRKVNAEAFLNYGLTAKQGFMGKGIYAIHEDELFKENSVYERYRNLVSKGDLLKPVSNIVFQYSGPYVEVLCGDRKEGIVNLLTTYIDGNNIRAVLEEECALIPQGTN